MLYGSTTSIPAGNVDSVYTRPLVPDVECVPHKHFEPHKSTIINTRIYRLLHPSSFGDYVLCGSVVVIIGLILVIFTYIIRVPYSVSPIFTYSTNDHFQRVPDAMKGKLEALASKDTHTCYFSLHANQQYDHSMLVRRVIPEEIERVRGVWLPILQQARDDTRYLAFLHLLDVSLEVANRTVNGGLYPITYYKIPLQPIHCFWMSPTEIQLHNQRVSLQMEPLSLLQGKTLQEWHSVLDTPRDTTVHTNPGSSNTILFSDHIRVSYYDLISKQRRQVSLFKQEAFCVQQFTLIKSNRMRCLEDPSLRQEL